MAGFSITIAGDSALNLEFAHSISPETSAMIRLAAENLTADPIEGITELVPTFCSLMVYYNPLVVTFDELSARLRGKLRDVGEADLCSAQDRADTRVLRRRVRPRPGQRGRARRAHPAGGRGHPHRARLPH